MYTQVPVLINQAVQYFQQGHLARAEELLHRVLTAQPRNFDALHIMGVVHAMQGRQSTAIELFRKALSINKSNNFLHFNLAKALSESGLDQEALAHHGKATQLAPNHAEAWLNYGRSLVRLNKHEEALGAYDKAITINPRYAEAWCNKAEAQQELDRLPAALACCDMAIEINPHLAEAHHCKGTTLAKLSQFEAALACYDTAIQIRPAYAQAHLNKGLAFINLGQIETALSCYDKAIEFDPSCTQAYYCKGLALNELDMPNSALDCFDKALALDPGYPEAYNGKGIALGHLNQNAAAISCIEKSLLLRPEYADAHWNLSCLLISEENYSYGWAEFEHRWQAEGLAPKTVATDRPQWDGAPSEHSLLLWGEQGLGDQVLYASVLPDLTSFPQKKYVALEKRLIPLFRRSMPCFEFMDLAETSDATGFEEHLPMGSLPGLFRLTKESFAAAHHPYLLADPERTAALRQKIEQKGKLVCGISWSSNRKGIGRHKSIGLEEMLVPLASEHRHFVNLQYGDTAAERQSLRERHGIEVQNVDEVDNLNDIDGLAALIDACDVVVTTSNTTAHLAGALGKTTLLLLPFGRGKFWYWVEHDGRNPWYPSVKMFAQEQAGNWQEPLKRLAEHLGSMT